MKLADAAEEEPRRAGEGERVGDRPEGHALDTGEERARQCHPQHRAVEGQSAAPDAKEVERRVQIVARFVYDRIEDTCAGQHTDDEIAEIAVEHGPVERRQPPVDPPERDAVADDVPDDVHHRVPPDRDGPESHDLRWNIRERDDEREVHDSGG